MALLLLPAAGAWATGEGAWMELVTNGVPADLAPFYRDTFGWTSRPAGEGARAPVVLLRGGRPVAGIAYHDAGDATRIRSCWTGFFAVPDPGKSRDGRRLT